MNALRVPHEARTVARQQIAPREEAEPAEGRRAPIEPKALVVVEDEGPAVHEHAAASARQLVPERVPRR